MEIVLLSSSLEELELWISQWTSESANKFNLLRTNRNLISLEFHKCFIGFDKVISEVAEALKENKTMKKLSMPKCYFIGRDHVDKLSHMLKENQTLEKIEMSVEYGCLSISTIDSVLQCRNLFSQIVSMLQMDKSRNIKVYIVDAEFICFQCATLESNQHIQLSPELKKSAISKCNRWL